MKHHGFEVIRITPTSRGINQHGYQYGYWWIRRVGRRWKGSRTDGMNAKLFGPKLSARTLKDALEVAHIADGRSFRYEDLPKGSAFSYSRTGNRVTPAP